MWNMLKYMHQFIIWTIYCSRSHKCTHNTWFAPNNRQNQLHSSYVSFYLQNRVYLYLIFIYQNCPRKSHYIRDFFSWSICLLWPKEIYAPRKNNNNSFRFWLIKEIDHFLSKNERWVVKNLFPFTYIYLLVLFVLLAELCPNCIIGRNWGYKSVPGDCTKFVQMLPDADGNALEFTHVCPWGQFWNLNHLTCQPSHEVYCADSE